MGQGITEPISITDILMIVPPFTIRTDADFQLGDEHNISGHLVSATMVFNRKDRALTLSGEYIGN